MLYTYSVYILHVLFIGTYYIHSLDNYKIMIYIYIYIYAQLVVQRGCLDSAGVACRLTVLGLGARSLPQQRMLLAVL